MNARFSTEKSLDESGDTVITVARDSGVYVVQDLRKLKVANRPGSRNVISRETREVDHLSGGRIDNREQQFHQDFLHNIRKERYTFHHGRSTFNYGLSRWRSVEESPCRSLDTEKHRQ